MLATLFDSFAHNLFKPILLFFYAGFLIPILGVSFEFPHVIYQGLTMYLLISIGWRGGEELAELSADQLGEAAGFMVLGFFVNLLIGLLAYGVLRWMTKLRKVDAATVAGYYGSDSAGTFVTCLGVLGAAHMVFAPYMPVMLAVMEIPGCLVALVIVARLRRSGMDSAGNMPGEPGYRLQPAMALATVGKTSDADGGSGELVGAMVGGDYASGDGEPLHNYHQASNNHRGSRREPAMAVAERGSAARSRAYEEAMELEEKSSLETIGDDAIEAPNAREPLISPKLLHEVLLNPGIFLLFTGILIGFLSRLQGEDVTAKNDALFVSLFQGSLCLFLLEMGMTASKRLKDLRTAGWGFISFGLLMPNIFALIGISAAHGYSMLLGQPFAIGTYALFAVLCAAASYIAVPAVQRLAIPEASPTLPLAASLGLTFSYNVTVGIPIYIMFATMVTSYLPVTK